MTKYSRVTNTPRRRYVVILGNEDEKIVYTFKCDDVPIHVNDANETDISQATETIKLANNRNKMMILQQRNYD